MTTVGQRFRDCEMENRRTARYSTRGGQPSCIGNVCVAGGFYMYKYSSIYLVFFAGCSDEMQIPCLA